jgi:hypothetical protein
VDKIALGYFISLIVGTVVSYLLMYFVFDKFDKDQKDNINYAASVGFFERIIYTSAVLIDQYGLITGWLVLKALVDWPSSPSSKVRSWPKYTVYLIGNALSIAFGIAGGKLVVCGFAEKCQLIVIGLLK